MGELGECPFCGSSASLDIQERKGYGPHCSNKGCHAFTGRWYGTYDEALKAWNMRPPITILCRTLSNEEALRLLKEIA